MNILYVSTVCSKKTILNIFNNSNIKILQSIQKFHSLLLEGFIINETKVTALSSIPIDSSVIKNLNIKRKENEKDIQYIYTNTSSNKYFNVVKSFSSSFYQTLVWGLKNKRKDSVIICDVLKISVCMGALIASKILRIKNLGLVTDIPGFMVVSKKNIYLNFASCLFKKYINHFDLYILLTEQMNRLVNLHKQPYIIMEGLVDFSMIEIDSKEKDYPRNIIYSGGIYERYGVKTLIDAFMIIDNDGIQLSIYGQGDLEDYISKSSLKDNRIKYFGEVHNNEVVAAQIRATLLVNPRPSSEEFTKYSFPSKNMEYMVSGTPVLTTQLPGMPKEYYDYVYLIDEENFNGIENALRHIISMDEKELFDFGANAKKFVLTNKNNIKQSKRVLELINSLT